MVVAAAVVAGLVLIGAVADTGDDSGQSAAEETTTTVGTTAPGQAVEAAVGRSDLAFLSREQPVDMMEDGCAAMTSDAWTTAVTERVVRSLAVRSRS